jgi:hypothetical protein
VTHRPHAAFWRAPLVLSAHFQARHLDGPPFRTRATREAAPSREVPGATAQGDDISRRRLPRVRRLLAKDPAMKSMNNSLPDQMKSFVDREVENGR